jgi:hypothetical protein
MPHPPMFASLTNAGPTCPACGPMAAMFMCPYGHAQHLYVPGVSPMPQQGYAYAPVAQVQPGASDQSIQNELNEIGKGLGQSIGEGIVQGIFGQ